MIMERNNESNIQIINPTDFMLPVFLGILFLSDGQ